MRIAFKEWAVICRALALGRQIVILRKGGLVEEGGEFRPDHPDFWLLPTYLHQSSEKVVAEARPLFEESLGHRPAEGQVVLEHFARVTNAFLVRSQAVLDGLRGHHLWTDDVVGERLRRWRTDAMHAMIVRVHALPEPVAIEMRDSYAGCTSWVELAEEISTQNSRPVLNDERFQHHEDLVRSIFV